MSPLLAVDLAGLALIAAIVWYFFLSRRPDSEEAKLGSGIQEIRILVKGGYSPDTVVAKAGVPLRLVFDRQETTPCSEEVVFPDFGVRQKLPAFAATLVDLPAPDAGRYPFACGMNMLHGTLVVSSDAAASNGHGNVAGASHGKAIDPICGMSVDPARAAATSLKGGETVYFCSRGCQERFDARA